MTGNVSRANSARTFDEREGRSLIILVPRRGSVFFFTSRTTLSISFFTVALNAQMAVGGFQTEKKTRRERWNAGVTGDFRFTSGSGFV